MRTELGLLLTVCGVGAVLKETTHFDADGRKLRTVTEDLPNTDFKCWQYTWRGRETDKTNVTGSCMDLENDDEPCFGPLVWTVDDENGDHQPNEDELEEQCSLLGCTPFCTPGPGQQCMKYVKMSGKNVVQMTKFCGEVTLSWGSGPSAAGRCLTNANSTTYCYCKSHTKCNAALSLQSWGQTILVMVLLTLCFSQI